MVLKGKAGDGLVTPAEARAAGLSFEEPKPVACHFCGRELEPLGAVLLGQVRWVSHAPCGCDGELEAERERESREREEAEAEMARRIAASGIKRRFRNAQTSIPAAVSYLGRFGDIKGRGLYFRGGVGAGKTTAACAIARALVYSGYSVVVTTTLEMLDSIQDTYGTGAKSAEGVGRYGRCDLLVLDDLGKEGANSWAMTTLFQVVNRRYEEMLPTIATSQYGIDEIERRLARGGERETAAAIASRLRETCEVVDLGNRDRRRRG